MDEIEFRQAYKNLLVLIDQVAGENTKAALKVIAHLVDGLQQRLDEMEDGDE